MLWGIHLVYLCIIDCTACGSFISDEQMNVRVLIFQSIYDFFVSPSAHGLGGPLLVAAALDCLSGPLDLDPLSAEVSSLGIA